MKGQRARSRTGLACPTPDKNRYRSQEKAELAVDELQEKFGKQGVKRLHAYLCACGYWHLGRRPYAWWVQKAKKRRDLTRASKSTHPAAASD